MCIGIMKMIMSLLYFVEVYKILHVNSPNEPFQSVYLCFLFSFTACLFDTNGMWIWERIYKYPEQVFETNVIGTVEWRFWYLWRLHWHFSLILWKHFEFTLERIRKDNICKILLILDQMTSYLPSPNGFYRLPAARSICACKLHSISF